MTTELSENRGWSDERKIAFIGATHDIIYPVYKDLPKSWHKGKENLAVDDLIADENDYYTDTVDPITENIFVYHPPHETQILLSEPEVVPDVTVNGITDFRIHIESKMLAMGIGFNLQWFKFNPNYFCGLGSKENYACLFVPPDNDQSVPGVEVEIDGVTYIWPILFAHPDGPFQQEPGNFSDMASFFPDYFDDGAEHGV